MKVSTTGLHRFCHSPAAEAVYCSEDVADPFDIVERAHNIEVDIVELV